MRKIFFLIQLNLDPWLVPNITQLEIWDEKLLLQQHNNYYSPTAKHQKQQNDKNFEIIFSKQKSPTNKKLEINFYDNNTFWHFEHKKTL